MPTHSTRSVRAFARSRAVIIVAVLALGGVWGASAATTAGGANQQRVTQAHALSGHPATRVLGRRPPRSRLAQSDLEVLGSTTSKLIPVAVKLDYDSVATYDGSVRGLAATSPSVTGR